jgi:glutathione synthase/RimK-type ligase-like ATP-grasp enzyme
MFHRFGIKPYKNYSEGYKKLRRLLGLARYNSRDKYGVLFNWGSLRKDFNSNILLNKEDGVRVSRNKVRTLEVLRDKGIRVPRFTKNFEEAKNFKFPVYCRKNYLNGGVGIFVAETKEQLIHSDFYTESINVEAEYRVHVFKDKILCWAKKIPKDQYSSRYIRNHSKGYKFSLMDNSRIFTKLEEYAIKSINAVGLDYGCIDCVLSTDHKFYVLETNSAVGLEGTTLDMYARAFHEYVVTQ